MTIAVAHLFPSGPWLSLEESIGRRFRRAVIVAADSLYSDPSTGNPMEYGPKVFRLARNGVAAIAGDVGYARCALRRLRLGLNQLPALSWDELFNYAQAFFDTTVPEGERVQALIGMVSRGEARILRVSSSTPQRFQPVWVSSTGMIGGSRVAETAFLRFFNDRTRLGGGDDATAVRVSLRRMAAQFKEFNGVKVQEG